MVKRAGKIFLTSIFLIFFSSCSISPTYSRKNIENAVKKICRDEYNLTLEAWLVGETLWVYSPFEKIFSAENFQEIDKTATRDIQRIFQSLIRVVLSIDTAPEFFVVAVSDIKNKGVDFYYLGTVSDIIKLQLNAISLGEWQEREVFLNLFNPQALGDYDGRHIQKYDISREEFLTYLIRQKIERIFRFSPMGEYFQINKLQAEYRDKKLNVVFDILIKNNGKKDLPIPFEEAKKAVNTILKIYPSFLGGIEQIEINDTANNLNKIYTKEDLVHS